LSRLAQTESSAIENVDRREKLRNLSAAAAVSITGGEHIKNLWRKNKAAAG
jgi:hypothetical protein